MIDDRSSGLAAEITSDEDYTKTALDLVRKALKGNGVRPDDVVVKSFDGSILEFTAATHIKFNTQISEKTVPGKAAGGNIFSNRQAAHKGAEDFVSAALKEPACIEQIKNLINQKPHHGFGLDNEIIQLSFLDREFVSHDSCNPCNGKGSASCKKCQGKGYEHCRQCHSQGFEKCNECQGNRQTRGPQGQMQPCHLCQGVGQRYCSFCQGNKQTQCSICQAKGRLQCRVCGGKGAQSTITSTEISAHCVYDFDAESLPNNAMAVVKKLGADLANQAQATPVTKENGAQEGLHLFYDVRVPQGEIEFSIKDQSVQAYLFGTKGAIKDIPDFLDGIIAPGMKKLAQAASGQGSVSENIRAAVRYKTVKQAMMFAARYTSKKAMRALLHYTPLGLSSQAAQRLIVDANTALNNATKQQRTMAVAYGGGSAAALGALYFFSPLRSALLSQVANGGFHLPINVVVLGLCAAAGYGVWQTLSSHARKQALEKLILG
jgi:hypothetical protein